MLVTCPRCRTNLEPPPGAPVVRCGVCSLDFAVNTGPPPPGAYGGPPPPSHQPPAYGGGGAPGYGGYSAPPPPSGAYSRPPASNPSYHPPPAPMPAPAPHPGSYGGPVGAPSYGPPGAHGPPPPAHHAPPPSSVAPASGRRKAVLVGIVYRGTANELRGCINDVKCMHYLLTSKFGFRDQDIVMLTEDEHHPLKIPTRDSIIQALQWLVRDAAPGDSLVFHYSGHGGQKRDTTGDEVDGMDETIIPLDFKRNGEIIDDDLNRILVNPLPPGVRLHAIVDACHSGTVLDLPYLCKGQDRSGRWVWEDHGSRARVYKGTAGGEAILFSGCDDHQTSADTAALSKSVTTGAMTYAFIQAIERKRDCTYSELMSDMRHTLKSAKAGGGGMPSLGGGGLGTAVGLLGMLMGGSFSAGGSSGFSQIPQITASAPFEMTRPFLI